MLCECRHIQANLSCGSWTKAEQIQQPLGLDLGNWEASYWAQVVRLVQSFSQFLRGKLKTWQYHHEFFLSCFLLAVLEFWMLYRLYRLYDLIWGPHEFMLRNGPHHVICNQVGLELKGQVASSRMSSLHLATFPSFPTIFHVLDLKGPRSWQQTMSATWLKCWRGKLEMCVEFGKRIKKIL